MFTGEPRRQLINEDKADKLLNGTKVLVLGGLGLETLSVNYFFVLLGDQIPKIVHQANHFVVFGVADLAIEGLRGLGLGHRGVIKNKIIIIRGCYHLY